jgi:hypothetical protein
MGEGLDKDNEFVCEKGMTSLVVDKIEGVVVGWYYGKNHNSNPLNNVLSCAGRDMAPDVSEVEYYKLMDFLLTGQVTLVLF